MLVIALYFIIKQILLELSCLISVKVSFTGNFRIRDLAIFIASSFFGDWCFEDKSCRVLGVEISYCDIAVFPDLSSCGRNDLLPDVSLPAVGMEGEWWSLFFR